MKKALVMCRTGMGSSMILVTKLRNIIKDNNFPLSIEHDIATGSFGHNADVIITMADLIDDFKDSGAYVIGVKDIMDVEFLTNELRKYFEGFQ